MLVDRLSAPPPSANAADRSLGCLWIRGGHNSIRRADVVPADTGHRDATVRLNLAVW